MKVISSLPLQVSLLALALALPARDSAAAEVEYEVTDLGHGVYMLIGQGGNIGLSVGNDGTFLIDDQFAPLTPKLLETIGSLTDQPVRYVLNTHWHGDHVGGNANLAAEGAVILAHDNVRTRMAAPGPRQSPAEALPVITYSDTTTYYLNGLRIHAFHVRRAHTDGDSMIVFGDLNIVHAADILFNGLYPFIDLDSGGSVDGYIAALERLLELTNDKTRIIAGHGPLASRSDVEKSLSMIREARSRVARMVADGKNLEEVKAADPLADLNKEWSWSFINGDRFTETLYRDLTE